MDPTLILNRYAPAVSPGGAAQSGFTLKLEPLPHRRYREAMFRIAQLHLRRRDHGVGGGLLLSGPSGFGKSTIARAYCAGFSRVHEAERTRVPVLLVSVPSSPTVRSLAGAMLEALGRRNTYRATAQEKTAWLYELIAKCDVELVLLDEFQHLFYAPTIAAFRDLTDWLKNFLEVTKVGLVGCGLPVSELVVSGNEQLARRFSERLRLTPFSLDDVDDFTEFRGVLKAFGSSLPLPCEVPLHEANLARRFHVASFGLLDYVVKILEGAVAAASMAGLETLYLAAFAAGFRDRVWRDVPERLNPFHPESVLRKLDRPGEVFHLHTTQDPVGSPMARSMGLVPLRGGAHARK